MYNADEKLIGRPEAGKVTQPSAGDPWWTSLPNMMAGQGSTPTGSAPSFGGGPTPAPGTGSSSSGFRFGTSGSDLSAFPGQGQHLGIGHTPGTAPGRALHPLVEQVMPFVQSYFRGHPEAQSWLTHFLTMLHQGQQQQQQPMPPTMPPTPYGGR